MQEFNKTFNISEETVGIRMAPAATRLLNESMEFDPKLLEINNWKLKDMISEQYVAVF